MSFMKCKSCNGVYTNVQTDGTAYFHVCPSSVPPAQVRNENLPSTAPVATGAMIAAGSGVQTGIPAPAVSA